ncbi:MAG: hypothetical protein ACTHKT_05165 [Solirubrobacterales bacterium]
MELMRATWTDSRLDDLNGRVTEIRDDLRDLRGEMNAEFRAVRGEIGDLKRIIIQIGWSVVGTLLIGMLGLIGTQL